MIHLIGIATRPQVDGYGHINPSQTLYLNPAHISAIEPDKFYDPTLKPTGFKPTLSGTTITTASGTRYTTLESVESLRVRLLSLGNPT